MCRAVAKQIDLITKTIERRASEPGPRRESSNESPLTAPASMSSRPKLVTASALQPETGEPKTFKPAAINRES